MSGIDLDTGRWYVETALVRLLAKADELVEAAGEEALSRPPEVEGANSVFALITHCCGVMEHWGGEVIAGREVNRDRAAEFTATGTIASLEERVAAQLRRWRADMADFDAGEEPRGPVERYEGEPEVITQGFVLLHVIEELYQHLGHVDLTVDLVLGR